ncbi:MAG: diguanylate cyclase response regulator [Proteobacteria bacterium]|nr:diguanylate cyclase response regulator [Pseudomonadota bacterium]
MAKSFNFHELKAADRLPSPCGTALAIMQLAQREDATTQELAQLVRADPALTSRVLRLANSPALGRQRPVASVADAVLMLGIKAVWQFALSLSLIGKHHHGSCQSFDYATYWSMSLARAVAIEAITARERTVPPEEAFTLGLLADIGRLALATAWPEEYSDCLRRSQDNQLLILEREHFAIDHEALSRMLLADWGFPIVYLDSLKENPEAKAESRSARFAQQLAFARQISRYCLADEASQADLLTGLRALAETCPLDEGTLTAFLDNVERQWQDWGKLIGVSREIRNALPATVEEEKAGLDNLDVLLVDDDPIMLARLSKQLTAAGHRVSTCRDGGSALKHVVEHNPQLVITDWHMAPMDGLQLCQALRASAFGKSLYLIMLTATESEDALVEAFAAGIDDYVTKPPSLRVLSARIRAGQRIISLQQGLARERSEIERYSAELAVANRRLELMAHTDLLTGLPNRRYAFTRLEQEWSAALRHNRPISLMVLDLDRFKSINDTLGHDAGDIVLAHAAKLMGTAVRANDIVCRMGGEEFLLIAPDTDGAAAQKLGDRIRSTLELNQPAGLALPFPMTVSIGVAASTSAKANWKDLIKLADEALYRAKQAGRNRVQLAT